MSDRAPDPDGPTRVGGWSRTSWLLLTAVLVATVGAGLGVREPDLPGSLTLEVLPGPSPNRIERALDPLADYLGQALRRSVRIEARSAEELSRSGANFDLAVLPVGLIDERNGEEILAWAKPRGLSGTRSRPFALFRRDRPWYDLPRPRLIGGDSLTWQGGRGASAYLRAGHRRGPARFARQDWGSNPYDHLEAIAALVHGAYDLAIVAESDLLEGLRSGLIDPAIFESDPAGRSAERFALVAGPRLDPSARRRVREAALNLDHFRYDRSNLPVFAVMAGLDQLGWVGFAPRQVLPSLRP